MEPDHQGNPPADVLSGPRNPPCSRSPQNSIPEGRVDGSDTASRHVFLRGTKDSINIHPCLIGIVGRINLTYNRYW